MCSAAKAIGNTELENKFAEGENIQVLSPFEAVGTGKHPGEVSQAIRRMRLGSLQMFPGPAFGQPSLTAKEGWRVLRSVGVWQSLRVSRCLEPL